MLSVEEQPIEASGSAEAMEGVTTGAEVGPSEQKTGEAGPAPVVYDLESFRRIPALQKMLEGTLQQTLKKCSWVGTAGIQCLREPTRRRDFSDPAVTRPWHPVSRGWLCDLRTR
jgi:hypothetical protein